MNTAKWTALIQAAAKVAKVVLLARGVVAATADNWIEVGIEVAGALVAIAADIWAGRVNGKNVAAKAANEAVQTGDVNAKP